MIRHKIRSQRKELNITQEQFAITLNVTRQTVIAIEKYQHCPSLELALRISNFFNKKVEDIFFLEEDSK